jgi:hypothetical protein
LKLGRDMLKGKDRYETWENYSILFIIIGVVMLAGGIGLTILTPKGIPVIITMLGSVISFLATVVLVFVWLAKEFRG